MRSRRVILAVTLLWSLGFALGVDSSEQAKLRFAATQHEIISILIQERDYPAVVAEFKKIVDLNLADEMLLVQEVGVLSSSLMDAQQYAVVYEILDEVLPTIETKESRFALLMIKGKALKQEGRLKDAVRVYREAQELK